MNMKSITGRTCSWTSCSRPTSSRRRCTVSLVWTVITIMYTVTSTILTYVLSIFTMVIAPIVSYKYIKELETTAQFEHHIRRGRSRAQHVRDREADFETAKNWGLEHFQRSKGRGPQGRAHIWVVFSCKSAEGDEWRGPKGQVDALVMVVLSRKEDERRGP